jgi:hypothetical protein
MDGHGRVPTFHVGALGVARAMAAALGMLRASVPITRVLTGLGVIMCAPSPRRIRCLVEAQFDCGWLAP